MADRESKIASGTHDADEVRRKKKSAELAPEKLKAQEGATEANHPSSVMAEPSLDGHATLFGNARFSHPANTAQKSHMVTQLQQDYGNAYVQRVVSRSRPDRGEELGKEELPGSIASRIANEKGSGKLLEPDTRSRVEAAFDYDFSEVRTHIDATADKLSKGLGAKAFTTGKDIFFKDGGHDLNTEKGEELLGHELAHVVQQEGTSDSVPTRLIPETDALEEEASTAGQALAQGLDIREQTLDIGGLARQTEGGGFSSRYSELSGVRSEWDERVYMNVVMAAHAKPGVPRPKEYLFDANMWGWQILGLNKDYISESDIGKITEVMLEIQKVKELMDCFEEENGEEMPATVISFYKLEELTKTTNFFHRSASDEFHDPNVVEDEMP